MNLSHLALAIAVILGSGLPAGAGTDSEAVGQLCLAPFHVAGSPPGYPPPIGEARLSETTWGPQHESHFKFFLNGRLSATLADGESAYLTGLPVAKPVRVRILLDDRPFESFSLDFSKEPDRRICLWLYPGYWHWINHGWDAKLGCKCGEAPEPTAVPEKGAGAQETPPPK